jgi:hypothetical protein
VLEKRGVVLPQPNAICNVVLYFCGIRLQHISSLRCPAAFSLGVPSPITLDYHHKGQYTSYGCFSFVQFLQKASPFLAFCLAVLPFLSFVFFSLSLLLALQYE